MMKRFGLIVSALLLSTTLFAEIELGLSYTPGSVLKNEQSADLEAFIGTEDSGDHILGFHVGYSFWWLFYLGWDSLIVPPWFVYQTTSYTDWDGNTVQGTLAPGFVNFYNVGIRPRIGPVYVLATIGVNDLYVHSYYSDNEDDSTLGVNMRVGFGFKFDAFSLSFTGTAVFNDFQVLSDTLEGIADGNKNSQEEFLSRLMPSIGFNLHL